MRKIHILFVMLLSFITNHVSAQDAAETVTTWDGTNLTIELNAGESKTFSYLASEQGTLYIMAPSATSNLGVTIKGGWYHDGAYDADASFDVAEPYNNGLGVFATIKVFNGDEIRFTLTASNSDGGDGTIASTSMTLQSKIYASNYGGDSWESPIELTVNQKKDFPIYTNNDTDYLAEFTHATFGRIVAPTDGVASIYTDEYLVYYIEEEKYGEEKMKYAVQDAQTNDHEFAIVKDKSYIIMIPNTRPTTAVYKITQ